MEASDTLIGLQDVLAAQEIIAGRVHRTPITSSRQLGDLAEVQLYLKLELFQKTGSFKPRGVLNKLASLSAAEKQKGVVTLSAGNHAQALAWGAAQEGVQATVVMPEGASPSKIEATRGYGGEVVLTEGSLLDVTLELQRDRDLTLVHPFDDPMIIAGQGTVGLEIVEELPALDAVFVGIGGGGLISGIATAMKARLPDARVIGVEPVGANAMRRSLAAGEPVHLEAIDTIADGLAAPFAGVHTLAHVKARVDEVIELTDAAIAAAMWLLMERCKIVPEPAGAAGLAGLLSGQVSVAPGSTVVCVVSGGNIDQGRLKDLL